MSKIEVNEIVPQSGTTLTLGGSGDTLSIASGVSSSFPSLTVSGDLTVDTDTLYVDSTNNLVGIGTSSPSDSIGFQSAIDISSSAGGGVYFRDSDSPSTAMYVGYTGFNLTSFLWNQANGPILFGTNDTERMQIDSSGNVGIGTSSPSTKLDVNGTVTATAFSGGGLGKVLQVVTAFNASSVSTTSTSYVDITSVTASITPSSASNKILVIYSSDALYSLVAATNVNYFHNVLRNTTQISQRLLTAASGSGGLQARGAMCITILDSPNTTSSVTYKAQHKVSNSGSTGITNDTSITLMEIAG